MRAAFSRMKPDSKNMVVEHLTINTEALLCVECGWEGQTKPSEAPWPVFQEHPCRLETASVSTSD